MVVIMWPDSSGTGQRPVADSTEHGIETWGHYATWVVSLLAGQRPRWLVPFWIQTMYPMPSCNVSVWVSCDHCTLTAIKKLHFTQSKHHVTFLSPNAALCFKRRNCARKLPFGLLTVIWQNELIQTYTNKQTTKLLTRTHSSFKTVKKSGGGSTHYRVLGDETVKTDRYVENIKRNLMPPSSGQILLVLWRPT